MKSELPSDDRLGQAWQRLAERHRDDPVHQVHPDELMQVLKRSGSEDDRLRILDRIARNPGAQRDLELLRAAQSIAPARQSRWIQSTMAIAALLLVAVAVTTWQNRGGNVERGSGENLVVLIAPAEDQPAARQFVWHAVVDAVRYDLDVLDANGSAIWHASTRDSTLTVPDSVSLSRASVWYVTVVTPSGQLRSTARRVSGDSTSGR